MMTARTISGRLCRVSGLSLALGMVLAARGEVEFSGYMQATGGEMRFVLADPAAKTASDWLGIGGAFGGYRVTEFDAKAEALTVVREGATIRLRLKSAGVRPGGTATAREGASATPLRDEVATELTAVRNQVINAQRDVFAARQKQRDLAKEGASEAVLAAAEAAVAAANQKWQRVQLLLEKVAELQELAGRSGAQSAAAIAKRNEIATLKAAGTP